MAVLGRVLVGSSERLDLADLLSIDSFTAADFKYLLQSFVGGNTPYILAGCQVNNPGDAIGTESVAINIHDSVVYHPTSTAGPFFYGLEEGNANAAPLIPELRKNATNFVYLTFDTFDTAQDSRAFWDPDQNGGTGSEFSQDVNTESVLKLTVGVSVATFPEGTIPIAKITLNASVITSIQDCRNMLFRLGTGGVSPNPFGDFNFQSLPDASYQRTEPSTTMSSSTSPNAFQGGDKNISTFKEWMDVVMTKLKELGGTTYWYESAGASGGGSAGGAVSTSFLKSKGQWIHSDATPGQVEFTEDITSINLVDPRSIIFRASTKSLSDEQVLYADLIDGAEINTAGDPVDWVNGGNHVNATAGAGRFANLSKGDWIKKKTDTDDKWLRVEEFYQALGGTGSLGTPTNALSILLSGPYQGSDTSSGASAEYTKGVYDSSELTISERGSTALQSLTGTFFWLAARSDVIHSISGIESYTVTIDNINEADGVRARCTAPSHGLEDGYRITIDTVGSAYGDSAGSGAVTYKIEVEDSNVFYINTTVTGDESTISAFYGIATMAVRQSDYFREEDAGIIDYTGIDLESDTHNFDNDQSIIVSDTVGFDDSYLITVPPSTVTDFAKKIQIPLPSAITPETTGKVGVATLPRMSVRDEFGVTKIVQGQATDIGDGTADAIKDYIGWTGSSTPDYFTSLSGSSYNAKDGMSNYNTDDTDNLTTRAAKLTAMMADRVQDRGLMFDGITTITNTAGTDITATATIDLIKPGSSTQTITLTTGSIVANSAVVATMNRNGSGAMSTSVEALNNNFVLEENKLILFYRLGTTDIYTWDGMIIPAGETHTYGERLRPRLYTEQDRTLQLIKGGTWSWDATTGGGTLTWDANAFVQVPGIADATNQIDAGSQASITDGNVLTVSIERTTGANSLSIVNSAVAAASLTEDTVVLARRIGTSIIIGDMVRLKDGESSDLIEDTTDQTQRDMQQNFNAKLIGGGTWSWDLGTSTLTWNANAFIQIPSLANTVNQIDAATDVLADGEVSSVEINRSGAGGSLTVSTTAIASLTHTPFTKIIARRVGDEVIIGESFLLKDGEYLELDGSLAEINRHHGQLKLDRGAVDDQITIAAPDTALLDGETLSQEMDGLLLDIASDITIDFNAGTIAGGATGTAFTPNVDGNSTALGAGDYLWYGIGLFPNTTDSVNKLTALVRVTPADTADTDALAPYPTVIGDKKLGFVQVMHDGTDVEVTKIIRFGTGAGGGGSEDLAVTFALTNNQLTPANISNFLIDKGTNTSFSAEISVQRYYEEASISDGETSTDFNPNTLSDFNNDFIRSIVTQPDGKVIIAGGFTDYGGTTNQNRLVRLNADGTEDATFNANVLNDFGGNVESIGLQSDGKIVLGGAFTTYNGVTNQDRLVRVNSDGTPDTAFNANVLNDLLNGTVYKVLIQSDGKILVGGGFTTYGGTTNQHRLVRLNVDGTVDSAFNSNMVNKITFGNVFDLAIEDDDSILIVGSFTSFDGTSTRLARISSSGITDAAFLANTDGDFNSSIQTVKVQFDGKIVVGGGFSSYDIYSTRLARVNTDGTADATFCTNTSGDFSSAIFDIVSQPDGKILAVGDFTTYNGVTNQDRLVRVNSDGTPDEDFNSEVLGNLTNGSVRTIEKREDSILFGGSFTTYGGTTNQDRLAKIDYKENIDTAFYDNTGVFNNGCLDVTVQTDGKILVSGNFVNYGITGVNRLARFNEDGTTDDTFNSNILSKFSSSVTQAVQQSDGKILIGGVFSNFDGISGLNDIIRLNTDGTSDTSFNTNVTGKFNNIVRSIVQQPDGKILVGGTFTDVGTTNQDRLVRLNSDGTLDSDFNANVLNTFASSVYSIALQSDGRIIVGGSFTAYDGTTNQDRLVRLNADGTEDATFNANVLNDFNSTVQGVTVQSDGKILVGGSFTTYGGTTNQDYAVRLNADGTADATFNAVILDDFNAIVYSIHVQQDSKIVFLGNFGDFAGDSGLDRLVRVNSDGTPDTVFNEFSKGSLLSSVSYTSGVDFTDDEEMVLVNNTGPHRLIKLNYNTFTDLRMQGTLRGIYNSRRLSWIIGETEFIGDDTGVDFTILPSGQLQYTSSQLDGVAQEDEMRFLLNLL